MNRNLARIILISAGIIWGLAFIGNKYILDNGWNESQLLFVRFLTATICIFIIYFKRILKTNFYVIKSGMFLGVFLYLGFFFQTWGLANTTASNNALITAGYIVLMPIIIYAFERTKIPMKTVIAGAITLVGISLITVDFKELTVAFGDILTFIGAFFYALHIYFLGKRAKKVDLFVLMSFQLLIFSVFATIMMISTGGMPLNMFSSFESSKLLYLAMMLGFFGSFVAFIFQSIGQKNTNEAEAAILISTEGVFGPVFAILFYNDPFNLFILFGIILVFMGIVLSETDILKFIKKEKGELMTIKQFSLLVFISALWGSSYIFMKVLSPVFGPVLTASFRLLIAAIFLFIYFKIQKYKVNWKKDYKIFFIVGILNAAIPFYLYSYAALHIDASLSVILNSTAPMFGAIFGYLLLKERLSYYKIIGLVIGSIGVGIVSSVTFSSGSTELLISIIACIFASSLYGLSGVIIIKYAKKIEPKALAIGSMFFAGISLLPFMIFSPIKGDINIEVISYLFVFGILCTAVAFLIYFKLIKEVGTIKALTVTYLMPVFGIIWAFIILGEKPNVSMIIGLVIILVGINLISKKKRIVN